MAPSSSDRVLQGTLLGLPSPALGPSTSSRDPLSARLSCSRLSDSGKDLKCLYLGETHRQELVGFGDPLFACSPHPHTRALTAPAGHQNPPPLGAACARGAGAASLSPPRCLPLSPGDPPSAPGSAGHSKKGSQKHSLPQAAAGCPRPSIFTPPSLPSSPRDVGSGRPAVGKGLWGSGAWLGAAGGAAPRPPAPAAPSAPPAAAPARKSLLPPPCKTATISAGVTQNPVMRGLAALWLRALTAGRGTNTNRSGSKSPESPGCCCRACRYARSSASCASFSFLNLCGTRVVMSQPGPCHPPAPVPATPQPHRVSPVRGVGKRLTHLELLRGWGVPCPDPVFKGLNLCGEKGLRPPPAAAPHPTSPRLGPACACSLWVCPASLCVSGVPGVPGQRHDPGQVGQPPLGEEGE